MHSPGGRFDPSATLRKLGERDSVLDGLVRRIADRWGRFRADSSPEAVPGLERDLRAALAQLTSLRTLLEGPAPDDGWVSSEPGTPAPPHTADPEPEEAERAVRRGGDASEGTSRRSEGPFDEEELEAFLREARAGWNRLMREPTPQALGHIEAEVRRLLHRADELRRGAAEEELLTGDHSQEPPTPTSTTRSPEEGSDVSDVEDSGGVNEQPPDASRHDREPDARSGMDDAAAFPPFRDDRTGLLTREGFDSLASGELKRSRRHGRPFALLLLRPRAAAGEPLRVLGAGVRRALRESDLVGRYGGVVLAVGLPETGAAEARLVADRLRGELERQGGWGDEAAAALAVHPRDGETLLTLADAARTRLLGSEASIPANGPDGQTASRAVSPEREANGS